jgi:hypothetical protein
MPLLRPGHTIDVVQSASKPVKKDELNPGTLVLLLSRPQREELAAEHVVREHHRGRVLGEILADPGRWFLVRTCESMRVPAPGIAVLARERQSRATSRPHAGHQDRFRLVVPSPRPTRPAPLQSTA